MAKAQLESRIKNLGNIYRVTAPLSEALDALKSKGIERPISARDLVYARMQRGFEHSLSSRGSWIREGVLYVPGGWVLFIRDSPLCSQEKDCYLNPEKYLEQAEEDKSKDIENRRVLILRRASFPESGIRYPSRYNPKGGWEIPLSGFNEEELTLWLFRDQIKNYWNFLNKMSILWEMEIHLIDYGYVDKQGKSIARPLWFGDEGDLFALNGNYKCFFREEESLCGLLKN